MAVVNEAMRELLSSMTMKDAIAHFTQHDVVAAPVNTIAQAAKDPHPWERRAMVEVPDFLAGTIAVSGDFWHFSRTPAVVGSTPKVGEHNEEVLGDLLGYSKEEIAKFYTDGVISKDHEYRSWRGSASRGGRGAPTFCWGSDPRWRAGRPTPLS